MFIKCLKVGSMDNNCYILCDKVENKAAVIDPGFDAQRVVSAFLETECKMEYVLLTHGHFDHIAQVHDVIAKIGGKLVVPKAELEFLNDSDKNLYSCHINRPFEPFTPDILVNDGDTLKIGMLEITFLYTPGHTPGSCCILCADTLFTGDTLFKGSAGRADLQGGDPGALRSSLARIAALPGDYKILPGHGEFTTLSEERANNPYLQFGDKA